MPTTEIYKGFTLNKAGQPNWAEQEGTNFKRLIDYLLDADANVRFLDKIQVNTQSVNSTVQWYNPQEFINGFESYNGSTKTADLSSNGRFRCTGPLELYAHAVGTNSIRLVLDGVDGFGVIGNRQVSDDLFHTRIDFRDNDIVIVDSLVNPTYGAFKVDVNAVLNKGLRIAGGLYGPASPQIFLGEDTSVYIFRTPDNSFYIQNGDLYNPFSIYNYNVSTDSSVAGFGFNNTGIEVMQGGAVVPSYIKYKLYNPNAGGFNGHIFEGGALSIKRGSASDSDSVIEVLNNAGTTTARINGDGSATLSGVIVNQLSQTRQYTIVSTGTIAWTLESGGTMDLETALTGQVTLDITNPVAGGQSNLYLTQGSTVQNIVLSLNGVTWMETGSSGTTSTNTITLASASFTANKTYCVQIFWSTTTRAYVTIR